MIHLTFRDCSFSLHHSCKCKGLSGWRSWQLLIFYQIVSHIFDTHVYKLEPLTIIHIKSQEYFSIFQQGVLNYHYTFSLLVLFPYCLIVDTSDIQFGFSYNMVFLSLIIFCVVIYQVKLECKSLCIPGMHSN